MIPELAQGEEFELEYWPGQSPTDEHERLRVKYWRPIRRIMLEMGVCGREYALARAEFRRLAARSIALYCPPMIIRIVRRTP